MENSSWNFFRGVNLLNGKTLPSVNRPLVYHVTGGDIYDYTNEHLMTKPVR